MVESGRVSGKARIRATNEKLSERVSEKGRINASTRNWQYPGEYREKVESVPLFKNCPDEFLKMLESVSVPEIGRIRVCTRKR